MCFTPTASIATASIEFLIALLCGFASIILINFLKDLKLDS